MSLGEWFLMLSAGASSSLNSSAALGRGDVHIQVNAGREDNNNYLIEGVSASDYNQGVLLNTPLPSPDVVQEFKVSTSLYDATQGRNGGGQYQCHHEERHRRLSRRLVRVIARTTLGPDWRVLVDNRWRQTSNDP